MSSIHVPAPALIIRTFPRWQNCSTCWATAARRFNDCCAIPVSCALCGVCELRARVFDRLKVVNCEDELAVRSLQRCVVMLSQELSGRAGPIQTSLKSLVSFCPSYPVDSSSFKKTTNLSHRISLSVALVLALRTPEQFLFTSQVMSSSQCLRRAAAGSSVRPASSLCRSCFVSRPAVRSAAALRCLSNSSVSRSSTLLSSSYRLDVPALPRRTGTDRA